MASAKTRNRIVATNGEAGEAVEVVTISSPKMATVAITIIGTSPYVQNRFGAKAMQMMRDTQCAGSQGRKGKKREPKDFDALYEDAKHISSEGWIGMPAPGFRSAMVSACRIIGYKMTHAKLGVFIEADGIDKLDGTPLVKITKGQPRKVEHPVRNKSGIDIRPRPMWEPGWEAVVRVRYDSDMFNASDVLNLMARVGCQVGLGEGRPDSPESSGQGWGLFRIQEDAETVKVG